MVGLSILVGGALHSFAIDFNDGGVHTLNDASLFDQEIVVSNGTTLNIATGAVIEGTIVVSDSSVLNVSGGVVGGDVRHGVLPTAGWVRLFDQSSMQISGGNFGGDLQGAGMIWTFGTASLDISGGAFGGGGHTSGQLRVSDSSTVEVSGGSFGSRGSLSGFLQGIADSSINVRGGTFGGSGINSGIFTAQHNATFTISGGNILPRTNGSVQCQTFDTTARMIFEGCEFSRAGTPLPFGVLPDVNGFRLDGTFASGETFASSAFSTTGNTFELVSVCNDDPWADAGLDQVVECAGALTSVSLEGSGSSDPDGDALTYEWSAPLGVFLDDPSSVAPTGQFPMGPSLLTLTVSDGNGGVASDDVLITVEDTTAPVVVCTTDVIALRPPDHTMRKVEICVAVTEECSDVTLTCEVSSSEPDDAKGDGQFTGDVDGLDGYTLPVEVNLVFDPESGCFLGEVELRAERDGRNRGRTYSIVCHVTDVAGNRAQAGCVVVVPHSARK
jgi:hypothetical protein